MLRISTLNALEYWDISPTESGNSHEALGPKYLIQSPYLGELSEVSGLVGCGYDFFAWQEADNLHSSISVWDTEQ